MTNPTALVQKLWNYCSILRDDGLSYCDCVPKMADEQAESPFNKPPGLNPWHGTFLGVTLGATSCPHFRKHPEFIGLFV